MPLNAGSSDPPPVLTKNNEPLSSPVIPDIPPSTATPSVTPQTTQAPAAITANPAPSTTSGPIVPTFQKPMEPTNVLYPKHTKKLFAPVFAAVILLMIATTSIAFALAYNDYPLIKPPKLITDTIDSIITLSPLPKPERIVIDSVLSKSSSLKSASVNNEVSLSTTSTESPVSSFKLAVNGPVSFEETERKAAEADVSLEVKFEGAAFNGSASVKTVEDTIYFKVNEIPFGTIYQQLIPYKNQWFYYKLPDEYASKKSNAEYEKKVRETIAKFLQKSKTWTKTATSDSGDYLLDITPPKSELDLFIFELVKSFEPPAGEKNDLLQSVQIENISKVTDKLANLKILAIASKGDYLIKRIDLSFDVTPENIKIPNSAIGSENLLPVNLPTYNFKFSSELSNYNKQIVVVPPEGAQDFNKIMEGLTKNPYNSINLKGNETGDTKIKSDIGQIAAALLAHKTFSKSVSYPSTLEDLVTTGEIQALPTPPTETGLTSYQYLKNPANCTSQEASKCTYVALYSPLINPKNPGGVWCFQSSSGLSQELVKDNCLAKESTTTDSSGNGLTIEKLLSPKSPVLGVNTNWEIEVYNIFVSILK